MNQFTRRAGQGRRKALTRQQGWYLLLCVMRNRRSTARVPQNALQPAIHVFLTKLSATDSVKSYCLLVGSVLRTATWRSWTTCAS